MDSIERAITHLQDSQQFDISTTHPELLKALDAMIEAISECETRIRDLERNVEHQACRIDRMKA